MTARKMSLLMPKAGATDDIFQPVSFLGAFPNDRLFRADLGADVQLSRRLLSISIEEVWFHQGSQHGDRTARSRDVLHREECWRGAAHVQTAYRRKEFS